MALLAFLLYLVQSLLLVNNALLDTDLIGDGQGNEDPGDGKGNEDTGDKQTRPSRH